jgi:hypothetical protein
MSQFREKPKSRDKIFIIGEHLEIWGDLETSSAIPFIQQPLIFKSHVPQENATKRINLNESLHNAKSMGVLHGIIRMARNPGDQLLRNKFRWAKSAKDAEDAIGKMTKAAKLQKHQDTQVTHADFIENSQNYCDSIIGSGKILLR